MARILIRVTDTSAREEKLGDRCVVGRAPSADCRLRSQSVSRKHAVIERRPLGFVISDLGSRNGTFLNGKLLSNEHHLRNKDRIRLGDELIQFMDDLAEVPSRDLKSLPPTRTLNESRRRTDGLPPTRPMRDRAAIRLPKKVGKFHLHSVLGKGGMGTVFLARDLESKSVVAVKFILSRIGRAESFLDFFHTREAVLARQIDHANVIKVFEQGVYRDQHFISMEFVRGLSLYHFMKSRRLRMGEILEILRQVACGLFAAHDRGVIHSDIKPANVLVRDVLINPPPVEPGTDTATSSDAILDFDASSSNGGDDERGELRYDDDLLKEIRRRAGTPMEDVLLAPPYFERASETRFIEHYIERLGESRGSFLHVTGELGAGKSRLIDEVLARVSASDAREQTVSTLRILELDCSSTDAIELLYEKLFPGSDASELRPHRLVEELTNRLDQAVPTVVRLRTLEKAHPLTSHLLRSWCQGIDGRPVLLIGETEDVPPGSEAKSLLDAVKPWCKELFLRPLTEYQIERYLTAIFKQPPDSPALAGDLYRLTRGNFAKLIEVFKNFVERGLLRGDPASGKIVYRPNAREFELEEGKQLYEVFRGYGRAERQILEFAAFVGNRFFFDVIFRFQKLDETSLFFVLKNFAKDGFIEEGERTWFRFTNKAFQEYLSQRIPPNERPQLHRRVSNVLHDAPVPPSAALFKLRAEHALRCNDFARAVRFHLEGAYRARIVYDDDMVQEAYHGILQIYRTLASRESARREIVAVLRSWFGRDGNWYEILGKLAAQRTVATVKIADFGISYRVQDQSENDIESGGLMGTPRYMAPERAEKRRGGPESDIFALGVILYEMLFGEPPFPHVKGWDVLEVYRRIPIHLPPKHNREITRSLQELLLGMLDANPRARWNIERVLKAITQVQSELGALSPEPEVR